MTAAPARIALVHVQQLRDGSWIGNAAWGGRTLTDGGADSEIVVRRLAARLVALPDAGRPDRVKLIRIVQGQRVEEEHDPASLV